MTDTKKKFLLLLIQNFKQVLNTLETELTSEVFEWAHTTWHDATSSDTDKALANQLINLQQDLAEN